jgi:hypothetical protein
MEYSSKIVDHLRIVAALCDEIGLVEEIDSLIPPDPRQKVTSGQSVKSMKLLLLNLSLPWGIPVIKDQI